MLQILCHLYIIMVDLSYFKEWMNIYWWLFTIPLRAKVGLITLITQGSRVLGQYCCNSYGMDTSRRSFWAIGNNDWISIHSYALLLLGVITLIIRLSCWLSCWADMLQLLCNLLNKRTNLSYWKESLNEYLWLFTLWAKLAVFTLITQFPNYLITS